MPKNKRNRPRRYERQGRQAETAACDGAAISMSHSIIAGAGRQSLCGGGGA